MLQYAFCHVYYYIINPNVHRSYSQVAGPHENTWSVESHVLRFLHEDWARSEDWGGVMRAPGVLIFHCPWKLSG